MILIHDYETTIFYTITSLMILGILTLILLLIYAPYNNYQINVKNLIILPVIGDFNLL